MGTHSVSFSAATRRLTNRFFALGLAWLGGCGALPLAGPATFDQATDSPRVEDTGLAVAPVGQFPADDDQPFNPPRPTFPFDPLLFPFLGPDDVADLLSLFLDDLLLDLLNPVGPQLNDTLSFLERLCLEGDDPDFVCRQRFGH